MQWHVCEECEGTGGWLEKEYAPRDFKTNPLTPTELMIRGIYGPIIKDQLIVESKFFRGH